MCPMTTFEGAEAVGARETRVGCCRGRGLLIAIVSRKIECSRYFGRQVFKPWKVVGI